MHTQDSTITPSAHLPTVEALLKQLDQMKGRVGAKQRLEFLLENGPRVVPGFDFEDAFDMSRRAHTDRIQKLEDLRGAMDVMKARWHDSSLEDDVKKAGDRLIGHLSEFVRQAERQERNFEVETLASLWEDAPDVFPAFGLPTPSYYPKERAAKKEVPREEDELLEAVESIKEKLLEEVAQENAKETSLPPDDGWKVSAAEPEERDKTASLDEAMTGGPADGITTGMIAQTKEELEKLDIRVPVHLGNRAAQRTTSSEYGEVVGDVSMRPKEFEAWRQRENQQEPLAHLGLKQFSSSSPEEVLEEEVDMLDIRSWTLAINEVLASNWKFDRQLRGRIGDRARMGITLIWKKGFEELRLDIERLAVDEVLVRLLPPRSAGGRWSFEEEELMYQVYAAEMTTSALAELHKDPAEFVKSILRSSASSSRT